MRFNAVIAAFSLFGILASSAAFAQPAPGAPDTAPGKGSWRQHNRDCSKAPDPAFCQARQEARQKAFAACKDKAGPEKRQCMHEQFMNFDCAKARQPERCEAHKKAAKECAGKQGPEMRQCVHSKLPPPDCTKSPNPQRCEQMQKAREACKDKIGPERRQCIGSQFKSTAPGAPMPSK